MKESIFAEFQYFIRRINGYYNGQRLSNGETIEDLEERFRLQLERGLVIHEPDSQEAAMQILLSDLPEQQKLKHLVEVRKTGKTSFIVKKTESKKLQGNQSIERKMERAVDMMIEALKKSGVKAQKQPLAVKMFHAAHELGSVDYSDPKDLKLLFVNTIAISGHAKKGNPLELANNFNQVVATYS